MNITENELEKIVKGCIADDRKCQQRLFQVFYGKMMAACMRYTKDRDTAQDILQEGFIKAFEKMEDFSFTGSFEGWLRRIIVNTAIDHFRKAKHTVELIDNINYAENDENDLGDENADDNDAVWGSLKPDDVIAAMQDLSPGYRTVFNLYVMENYTHKEIAEMLEISIGTSKSNLAKARANLKKILEQKFLVKTNK